MRNYAVAEELTGVPTFCCEGGGECKLLACDAQPRGAINKSCR